MPPRKISGNSLDFLKSQNKILKKENEDLKEKARFIMCIWCGDVIDAGVNPEDAEKNPELMQKVVDACRDHDKQCLLNPLNKKIQELEIDIKRLNREIEE